MWLKKVLRKLFKRNSICDKCGSPSQGNSLCERCQKYTDLLEKKNIEEEEAKEEVRRRSWIVKRDAFLENQNG